MARLLSVLRQQGAACFLGALLGAAPLCAQVSHRGELVLRAAASSESTQQVEAELVAGLESALGRLCEARVEVRLRVDETDRLEPGRPRERSSRTALSQRAFLGDHADAELRELLVGCTFARGFLTLGKQQTVWGEAGGLKVLDVVNPQSFRDLLSEDFDDSRIALWTANLDLQLGQSSELQIVWIPDATVHQFPLGRDGSPALFEPVSPLYRPERAATDLLSGSLPVQGDLGALSVQALGLTPDDPFLAVLAQLGVTELSLEDLQALGLEVLVDVDRTTSPSGGADFGLRLKTRAGNWDLALYRLRHLDPVPLFSRSFGTQGSASGGLPAVRVHFDQIFQRVDLYGFSFNNAFGRFVVRGEVGWTPDKRVQVLDLGSATGLERGDELAYVLGLDWQRGTTLVSGQLFQTTLQDLDGVALRGDSETTLTALVQHRFGDDSEHQLRLLWVHGLDRDDGWVQFMLQRELRPGTSLQLGAESYYGDETGFWGQFRDKDRARVSLQTSW